MDAIINLLDGNTILVMFLVITIGTLFGAIPFGPVKFGAAGALFMGLFVGAFVEVPGDYLPLLQDLGLGLFVYMVGLEAGENLIRDFKEQWDLMLGSLVAIVMGAVAAIVVAVPLGLSRELAVGAFSGALTSTPSLSLAAEQTGSDVPAVGYSIGYPTGVFVAILLVAFTVGRNWKAKRDQENPDEKIMRLVRLAVTKDVDLEKLLDELDDQFRVATIQRGDEIRIVNDNPKVKKGDRIMVIATKAALPKLIKNVGRRLGPMSARTSNHLTVQEFSVSNQSIGGQRLGNLPLYKNHRAQVLRIRRGDDMILATDDTHVEMGDTVQVIVPSSRAEDVKAYFGDSVQSFSELDWIATAGGLAIGFLMALIEVPLPGGSSFALGSAAGPLFTGLILGSLQRTGRVAWQLPRTANYTMRQFGLMIFLAAVGVASGPAFVETAFTLGGLKTIILAAVISLAGCGGFLLIAYLIGQSAPRANGGMAGILLQPAVLQYAMENSSDSRIMSGYNATTALALIFKIIIIPFMLVV